MIKKSAAAVILSLTITIAAFSQTGEAHRPSFEVASIKPNTSGSKAGYIRRPEGGRFSATNTILRAVIRLAYGFQDAQIVGGPDWINSDRFDFEAKSEAQFQPGEFNVMLQSLLEERFRLKTHREMRELPVFELFVAKNGKKLVPSSLGDGGPLVNNGRGRIVSRHAPPEQWVQALSTQLGRQVIDRTGLHGTFDFTLEWAPDPNPTAGENTSPASTGPTIFTALQEQLGLRLESSKTPAEVIVIDSVERPSEN